MIDYISAKANCSQTVSNKIYDLLCKDSHFIHTDCNGEEFHQDTFCHQLTNFKIVITEWFNTGFITVEMRGSLHKLYKGNNHSNFTLYEVKDSINLICNRLEIEPFKWRLHAFEFGVNINFKPAVILRNLINFNGYEVGTNTYKSKGYLKKFVCSQFELKVYDKSKQYGLNENVLRYELKVLKMDYFGKGTNWTLQDLVSESVFPLLSKKLYQSLNKLIITQTIVPTSNREQKIYEYGCNPLNWVIFKDTAPNKNSFSRKRKQFNDLIDLHTNVVMTFKKEVIFKWDALLSVANLPILEIHYPLHSYNHILDYSSTKRCFVCNRDISNQQRDSKYCSEKHTGSRKCRDKAANFMKRERRLYPQPTLFDVGYLNLDRLSPIT